MARSVFTPPLATPEFAASTRDAGSVLVLELAGLGDLIRSLPALRAVRDAYPAAELHCAVRPGYGALLRPLRWIDGVTEHDPTVRFSADGWRAARAFRDAGHDVTIDLIGGDYAGVLARLTGARRRLARRPGIVRPRHGWRFATDRVEQPFRLEPMHLQRLRCLQQAGIPACRLPLGGWWDDAGPIAGTDPARPYLHVSPFARGVQRELPLPLLRELLLRLQRRLPGFGIVLSCAPCARERQQLQQLARGLPSADLQLVPGTLDVVGLCRLIRSAQLHLSGDSGSMHVAGLVGTPSVSWFLRPESIVQWKPDGARHAAVLVDPACRPGQAVADIERAVLAAAVAPPDRSDIMSASRRARPAAPSAAWPASCASSTSSTA